MKTKPIHHTNILPLRWLANYVFSPISSFFLHLYLKWGTTYQVIDWETDEVLKRLGSDYDENGIPYWEKTGTVDPDYNPEFRDGATHPAIQKDLK